MYRLKENTVDQIEEEEPEKEITSFFLYKYQIEILEDISGSSKSSLLRNILADVLDEEKLETKEAQLFGTKLALDRLEGLYAETTEKDSLDAISHVQEILIENSDNTTR